MLSRFRAHLPAWRRALRRRRRLLAALAVAALVAALLPALLPPSARGVDVVIADAALAPGTVLAPSHLSTTRIAEELVPPGAALEVDAVRGRTLRIPLDAGALLLPGMLVAAGAPAIPEGSVLMAVPVPAVLVPHLPPGAGVELLSTDPTLFGSSGIDARVLEVPESAAPAPVLGAGSTGTAEVLVIVAQERAREVAHALGVGAVVVTVIG
ncbi:hypothetical protein CFK38_12995 [Brachybacterium vulturis]|uniref:SAF domain-containing protein n=1 Tax=Brachybacterium vulturis TaxID=2017484 RepID=A0A291GPA9_9MICO|nr:SAF domain-containing protein [Brachybacterium vulturis]ATG52333.1 hypothetical protein CFK38_12995 [Brachybacterium vulturis]